MLNNRINFNITLCRFAGFNGGVVLNKCGHFDSHVPERAVI